MNNGQLIIDNGSLTVGEASARYQSAIVNSPLVPSGYKQTEVGVIPEDWNAVPLVKLADIKRGASPRPIDSPIWFDQQSNTGWLRISDVTKSSKYLSETTQNLSSLGIQNSRFVSYGNLVMSICATVGRPILTKKDVCIHDGFVVFLQLNADVDYLYYILSSLEKDWFKHGQTGSQMNLNTGLINLTKIALPPTKAEQRAIAASLSDVDALLAKLDQLIAKKRDLKQAVMQQLLTGQTRLPRFSDHLKYKQTEIGNIPEDWRVEPFSRVTDLITCGIAATPKYVSESDGFPFLSSTNVKNGAILWRDYKYIDANLHRQLHRNNPPKRGDILYSRVGTIGEAAVIEVDFEFSVYVSLTLIKPKAILDTYFLMHLLNSLPYKQRAKDQVYLGGGVGNLNVDVVRRYPIVVPSLTEQTAIATVLSDMDAEIATLEARRDKTRDLKQGMMQELLTGRIRLV